MAQVASKTIKLGIIGCCGRMGRAIASLAVEDPRFRLVSALEALGQSTNGQDYGLVLGGKDKLGFKVTTDLDAATKAADVLIEFTAPDATITHAGAVAGHGKGLVIGTTGLSEAQVNELKSLSSRIPIVFSPNMSVGVNVLFELARVAALQLGNDYDVEVIEAHHKQKKDAPSGTAKRLVEVLAQARKQKPGAIPTHAVRAGDIIGDHTVILAGPSERLELTHRAQSRSVFAQGALRAAAFVARQSKGWFDMSHVLKASSEGK